MNGQPDRLAAASTHQFSGSEIDRTQPLRFTLNGMALQGFAGDSVLSAALAAGLIGAGHRLGSPLGLDERFAPPVAPADGAQQPEMLLPMARTPIVEGLALATLPAPHGGGRWPADLRARIAGRANTLGLPLDGVHSAHWPWAALAPARTIAADLCVVGGGIAGLGAAVAAGEAGHSVVLVERRPWLGGDARLFGSIEGEPSPDLLLAQCAGALQVLPNVTVMAGAEALSLLEGRLRVHAVTIRAGRPEGEVVDIVAPRVVLASGTVERLPVFPGNRLPGVVTAAAAFHRASRYGVWHGGTALFNSATSVAYRLVTRASDAGVTVLRLTDTRDEPRSRFIEFSKAYGVTLSRGMIPVEARPVRRRPWSAPHLAIRMAEPIGTGIREISFEADQLIVSGGWQPDLRLWLMAGGGSTWSPEGNGIVARGTLERVALAGSAAGYRTLGGCMASGRAAVAALFGAPMPAIEDPVIDTLYETPDGPTPVAPTDRTAQHPAYLDGGTSLNLRVPRRRRGLMARLWPGRDAGPFAAQPHPLSIGDVTASVLTGLVAADEAGEVARERGIAELPAIAPRAPEPVPADAPAPPLLPRWLAGRFGPDAEIWAIAAEDGRRFEPGALLQANSDSTDPLRAIGVILGPGPSGGTLALVAAAHARAGARPMVQEGGPAIAIRLERRFEDGEGATAGAVAAPG